MNIATWIIVAATIAIAISSWLNWNLVREIKKGSEKHDQETRDLYQAIVIATAVSHARRTTESVIREFFLFYKGKTEIFRKEGLKKI